MTINLEMLRIFQVVAEQGSLSAASNVLARTPSAVSMRLKQLEEHLGGDLFVTDRKNELTPLGRLVLEESHRANDAFERARQAIRRHVMSTAGTVRIAAVPSATITLLPEVVARFRTERPDVRLEISDIDTASVVRRIQLDEADIGLISSAPGAVVDGEAVVTDVLGIVCREDGPLAHAVASGVPVSWDLLVFEPLIANPLFSLVGQDRVRSYALDCNLWVRNTTALLAFVRSGIGVTILPEAAMRAHSDGLRFFVPEDPLSRLEIRKIRRADQRLSPVAQTFWTLLETIGDGSSSG